MYNRYIPFLFIRVKDDQRSLLWDLKVVGSSHLSDRKIYIEARVFSSIYQGIQVPSQQQGPNHSGLQPPWKKIQMKGITVKSFKQGHSNSEYNICFIFQQNCELYHLLTIVIIQHSVTVNTMLGCKFTVQFSTVCQPLVVTCFFTSTEYIFSLCVSLILLA